jgi:hypothetical protein
MNYQDKWLRLVAYPVLAFIIRHFGDMTPWGQLLKQPLYYADLVWDLLIVFTSWESNRRLIMPMVCIFSLYESLRLSCELRISYKPN